MSDPQGNRFPKYTFIVAIIALLIAATSFYLTFVNNPSISHNQVINYTNTQWGLAQQYEQTGQYEKSIEIYKRLFEKISDGKYPYQYAKTQLYLGKDYALLNNNDRKKNLLYSITCFKEALKTFNSRDYPTEFAETQFALGGVYATLAQISNKDENLKNAITALNSSLIVYNETNSPENFARIHASLGSSYLLLLDINYDNETAQKALDSYRIALKYYTKERDPFEYGNIQLNIGYLSDDYETKNYAFNESASVFSSSENNPDQFASAQAAIGTLYSYQRTRDDKSLIEKSIIADNSALTIYSEEYLPLDYSRVQTNLGSAYGRLGLIENKETNLENGKIAFNNALKVITKRDYPLDYATIQLDIGVLYSELGDVKQNQTNRQIAENAYKEASFIFTNDSYPDNYKLLKKNYDSFINLTQT